MYKKIKSFLTTNLYWKALSILLAIGLWFVVMNINNPTEIKTFTLNISLLNEDKLAENNLAILNIDELKNQKAEIKIQGTRTTLDELNKKYNKDNIKLTLDLEQILSYNIGDEPLEVVANLKPTIPNIPYPNNNFEIVSFYPITSTIYVDKVITIPKKIHPKTVGEIEAGYIASEPELSSEYIQVTGPKSVVDKIQVIYAEVDIADATSTIEESVKPVAYDEEGNKVSNISFNLDEISVKVPIVSEGNITIAEPKITGELPDGYIVDSVTYNPKTIEVIGSTKDFKKLTKIELPDIDITGLNKSTEYTYDITSILNQNNLRLKNAKDSKVEVFVNIKQATTKQITIPTNNISILGYNDEFIIDMPDEFAITLAGEDEQINNIDVNNIDATIDVTGLTEGKHTVEVDIKFSNDVKLVSRVYIDINIYNKNDATQDDTSEEASTEETTIEMETKENDEKISIENTETTS